MLYVAYDTPFIQYEEHLCRVPQKIPLLLGKKTQGYYEYCVGSNINNIFGELS